MQGSFVKWVLIGTIAVVLTLAWAVIPLAQAEPCEMQEGCDLAPAPADLLAQTQPQETQEECELAPVPAVSLAQGQPQEMQNFGLKAMLPNPQACQSERSAESQNISSERSRGSAPTRNDNKLVMHKPCRELDDCEMDGVCGGITGSFDMTQSGNMNLTDNSVQSIALNGQAQQNLSSLVNILSINSTISVMMNLNVNINSTVGTVNQGNTGTQTGIP